MNDLKVSPHHSADVAKHKWYPCNHDGHIGRGVKREDGKWRVQYLHQFVWVLEHGRLPAAPMSIDHSNNDPSDNRIDNLRPATKRLQCLNRGKAEVVLPKGVKQAGTKYAARLDGRVIGRFDTVDEASIAYQSALEAAIEDEVKKSWELFHKEEKSDVQG
jgi:hypothetical protein